jgi:glycosyltransferase involved in cell wall biosynthesis
MALPRISVVMPSFNQAAYIDEAIRSVLEQDYPAFELLVIDGGSRDGAVDVIRRHADRLAYWVSEPDRGQSHAINKGLERTSGDLLTWLNSDDVLLPGALRHVGERFARRQVEWIAGSCLWVDPEGNVARAARGTPWSGALARRGLVNVGGPSSFFTRELLTRAGPIDERFHYMMDTELWLRFARAGARFDALPRYLWALRLHPAAKMSGHHFAGSPLASPDHPAWKKREEERQHIRREFALAPGDERSAGALSRLLRLATFATPRALLDTWRYRGRRWIACVDAPPPG